MRVRSLNNVGSCLFGLGLALALGGAAAANGEAVPSPGGAAPASSVARPATVRAPSALERRVTLLARELDLDPSQQIKVRALLQSQREQVTQTWNDESVPGAVRVKRTQAISERTEDEIRALLTDEQKQKYFKPRPVGVAAGGTPADLAKWMDKVNGR